MRDLIVSESAIPVIQTAVISGLEVAGTASRKATHYHTKEQQSKAVFDSVEKLYSISKELPLLIACQPGVSGFFIQSAILNDLENTAHGGANRIVDPRDWFDDGIGNVALYTALDNLSANSGIPYVLRMFLEYRDRKINNSRANKLALRYIWGHPNLEFISVKYKDKVSRVLRHVYGQRLTSILISAAKQGDVLDEKSKEILNSNVFRFSDGDLRCQKILLYLFDEGNSDLYDESYPVISQVYKAHTDITGCDLVPEEILTGLLSNPDHPQHQEMWSSKERQNATLGLIRNKSKVETANSAVRKTKQEKLKGIIREKSLASKASDPIALYKTVYENPDDHNEAMARLATLAVENKYENFPYNKIAIIQDRSISMQGHYQESKNTALAAGDFINLVLSATASDFDRRIVDGSVTNLADAFISVVSSGEHDAIFIISDGYENYYDGLLSSVVQAWRDTGDNTPVFHISPVGAAEHNAKVRPLGAGVVSFTATYKNLPLQLQAKLLEGDIRLWLQQTIRNLAASLPEGEVS